eukprot:gb/GEZJ01006993.1/.p1 GENE.gb/GEZJ01006993.1/~~gb/GEZJ01006993.1/.p1  ORF type:complete len:111 (-),score=4.74 gb/GEZJ01006993.1/:31-363(-)
MEASGFSLTIKTLTLEKDGEGYSYVRDFQDARHNHRPSITRAGIHYLPSKMYGETLHMTSKLHFSLPGIIKYLKDRYGMVINLRSVRKMLGYGCGISNPKELECTNIFKE